MNALNLLTRTALLAIFLLPRTGAAQDRFNTTLEAMSNEIVVQCEARTLLSVAVLDFSDADGNPSPLGLYMAEQLAVRMASASNRVEVVDRQYLHKVIEEQKRSASGVFGGGNTLEIGKLVHANAVVTGKYVPTDRSRKRFTLTAVILDTERGTIVGSAEQVFDTPPGLRAGPENEQTVASVPPPSKTGRVGIGFQVSTLLTKLSLPKEDELIYPAPNEVITAKRKVGWRFGMSLETAKDRQVRFITGIHIAKLLAELHAVTSYPGGEETRTEEIGLSVLQVHVPAMLGIYSAPFGSSRFGLRVGAILAFNASSNTYESRSVMIDGSNGVSSDFGSVLVPMLNTLSPALSGELLFENRTRNGNTVGIGLGYGYVLGMYDRTGLSDLLSGTNLNWVDQLRGDYRPGYLSIVLQYVI